MTLVQDNIKSSYCNIFYSIHNLMAAKEVFMEEMHHCEKYTDKSQVTLYLTI